MGTGTSTTNRPRSTLASVALSLIQPSQRTRTKAIKNKKLFSILLQGAGESGKSTVFKQLKLKYGGGFDDEYRLLQGKKIMRTILRTTIELLESIDDESKTYNALSAQLTSVLNGDAELTEENVARICALLEDKSFSELLERLKDVLPMTYSHNLEDLKSFPKWGGTKWKPTKEEVLLCRSRTVGVNSSTFKNNDKLFEVHDVGGQKNQRSKYLNLFNDIDQIIYVASLAAYNLDMWESPGVNRLADSLHLFHQVTTKSEWKKASVVLFLNKMDLFEEKYLKKNILLPIFDSMDKFPDPPKAEDEVNDKCELAIEWFTKLYCLQLPPGRTEKDFIHVTVAIEPDFMSTIIRKLIENIGKQIVQNFYPDI